MSFAFQTDTLGESQDQASLNSNSTLAPSEMMDAGSLDRSAQDTGRQDVLQSHSQELCGRDQGQTATAAAGLDSSSLVPNDLTSSFSQTQIPPATSASSEPPAYDHTSAQSTSDVAARSEKSEEAPEYQSRKQVSEQEAARIQDLGVEAGGDPIHLHIYRTSMNPTKMDEHVTDEDKSHVLYRIAHSRSVMTYTHTFTSVIDLNAPKEIGIIRKGMSGFSNIDTRIEMNNGWLAVMHTTGVNFKRYHFSGLKSNTDQFEWCARQSGGILDCTNLRSKEVIASYRPTSWAAMKKAELIINKNYAIDTDLLLMSVIGFVEWRKDSADEWKMGYKQADLDALPKGLFAA